MKGFFLFLAAVQYRYSASRDTVEADTIHSTEKVFVVRAITVPIRRLRAAIEP